MRSFMIAFFTVSVCAVLAIGSAGDMLSRSAHSTIGNPPSDLPAEPIEFRTTTNGVVSGWLIRGKTGLGAVLLLHGVRSDRRQMIGRAKFLNRLGYSVLLIDLPAHGESSGARITYGFREAEGVKVALDYLSREFPYEKIGVISVSLGAASLVFSRPIVAPSAVVLESMFPTIEEAVDNRLNLHLGSHGALLTPLILWQLPLWLGVSVEELHPITALALLQAPVLIASGTMDRHTTLAETKRIFEAAHAPKELWVVEGAAHVDLYVFEPDAYKEKISTFLAKYLRHAG
jgi:alpha-beta hydrolase superfamily lysophospholipase